MSFKSPYKELGLNAHDMTRPEKRREINLAPGLCKALRGLKRRGHHPHCCAVKGCKSLTSSGERYCGYHLAGNRHAGSKWRTYH